MPFLRDIETHVRFLIAIPVLVIAELVVHQRTRSVVKLFLEREIVASEDIPKFHAIIESAMRVRNSVVLEAALIVFVYTAGRWVWLKEVALGSASWYAMPEGANLHLTLPGYWFAFVSIPIAQFILLRWYLRLVIWFWLLWRASRLKLRLLPTHPDSAGGIGFLGRSSYAFAPILFAQGVLLSGIIANRLLYEGQNLLSFKMTIVAMAGFFVLVILGPLTIFSPQLASAKQRGLREYGTLATSRQISTRSCYTVARKTRPFWAQPTFNLSPIWETVTQWCVKCVLCPLDITTSRSCHSKSCCIGWSRLSSNARKLGTPDQHN